MGKVHLKGGTWTNVEDEILKAAVMKYGMNQWARISSLLIRKTPKQCKARWTEWLDPAVRKTAWTRDEEERLLHLAKVMPQQWRTIAPLIGRTAAQCLEHYEELLDAARRAEQDAADSQPTLSELKKPREEERDPAPETRPARPDPVDMDDDEKEMLAEARARLANTQGKKAKRKARMRLLEDAKRATAAKKEDDLAAAGISGYVKKAEKRRGRGKKQTMDYNAEIPFEMLPAPGLHDIVEELEQEDERRAEFDKQLAQNRQFIKTRELEELEARKRDAIKDKERVAQGHLPAAVERQLLEQQTARRLAQGSFKLPKPVVTQESIEAAAKAGLRAEEAIALAGTSVLDTPMSTLSGVMSTPMSTMSHTPRLNGNDMEGKGRILAALNALPPPKNEFEVVRKS